MRLYRLKFDGISAQKKQINVPTESSFKLGIEIAGYEDLETAKIMIGDLSPEKFDKDGKRAIFGVQTADSDISLPITLDFGATKTDASVFVNVSNSQPAVGYGEGGGSGSTIALHGTFADGSEFSYDVLTQDPQEES